MLDQVLALALRPFLARCADVWMTELDLAEWSRSWCLVCGGEPDFAVLPSSGDRWLICGRCSAQWPFTTACPFCGNDARAASRHSPAGTAAIGCTAATSAGSI